MTDRMTWPPSRASRRDLTRAAARDHARRDLLVALSVVLALAAGVLAVIAPLASAGVAFVWLLLVFRGRVTRSSDPAYRANRWLPYAWLALFLLSNVKLAEARSPLEAASGSFSPDNVIELLGYAVVGALAAAALYGKPRSAEPLRVFWPAAWATVAVVSSIWSLIPLFTLTRGLQLFVPILLAAHSIRVWREDPEAGEALWRVTLRLMVLSLVALTAAGFAIHDWPDGRFQWPWAQHAVLASGMVGFGLVALAAGGRRLTGFSRFTYAASIALFAAALAFGQTRSVLAGVALALLVTLWLAGGDRPLFRYLAFPLLAGAAVLTLSVAHNPIGLYLSRGQSAYTLSTLNGRLDVWQLAVNSVSSTGHWIQGFGQGAARVLLFQQLSWAGEAHNTWLEILLGTGLLGLCVAAIAVIRLGYEVLRPRVPLPAANRAAAALFVYLLVLSEADYYLSVPGFAFTAFMFFHFLVMGQRGAVERTRSFGTAGTMADAVR